MGERIYRSKKNKVFAGVLGGLGEYLDVDPVLLRIIWLAITVFTGFAPGIVVYILVIFVIPAQPTSIDVSPPKQKSGSPDASAK